MHMCRNPASTTYRDDLMFITEEQFLDGQRWFVVYEGPEVNGELEMRSAAFRSLTVVRKLVTMYGKTNDGEGSCELWANKCSILLGMCVPGHVLFGRRLGSAPKTGSGQFCRCCATVVAMAMPTRVQRLPAIRLVAISY